MLPLTSSFHSLIGVYLISLNGKIETQLARMLQILHNI